MMNDSGFDLWADDYDKSVGISDDTDVYPFAGYRRLMNEIYGRILSAHAKDVLDIGFGTAVLSTRLYEQGCHIYGQDFSARMLDIAQQKMPDAALYRGDFSEGLCAPLAQRTYDAIIATYSLHHLTDAQKIPFLHSLLPLLNEGGAIYVGDVMFRTRDEWNACRTAAADSWDSDEIYFVYDELTPFFPQLRFEPCSHCSGLLILQR